MADRSLRMLNQLARAAIDPGPGFVSARPSERLRAAPLTATSAQAGLTAAAMWTVLTELVRNERIDSHLSRLNVIYLHCFPIYGRADVASARHGSVNIDTVCPFSRISAY